MTSFFVAAICSYLTVIEPQVPCRFAARSEVPAALYREAPRYPRHAIARGTEGCVVVGLTVGREGIPRDLAVRRSLPAGVFDWAAMRAIANWRFAPVPEARRFEQTLTFHIEGRKPILAETAPDCAKAPAPDFFDPSVVLFDLKKI